MAEPDHVERWLEKHIRPALPGWTRYGWWLMSPVEQDLVRIFEVTVWGTRTTLQGWVAPVCVPWEQYIGLRHFFRADVPGAWGLHRPQDVPKVRGAIERFLPKFEATPTLEQWVAANKKYMPPGGLKHNYAGNEGTIEEIALPLIALGDYDRAAKLLDRAWAMVAKFKPLNDEQAAAARPLHTRIAAVRAALASDPASARRKLAAFRRQNVKRYGLATKSAARRAGQTLGSALVPCKRP